MTLKRSPQKRRVTKKYEKKTDELFAGLFSNKG